MGPGTLEYSEWDLRPHKWDPRQKKLIESNFSGPDFLNGEINLFFAKNKHQSVGYKKKVTTPLKKLLSKTKSFPLLKKVSKSRNREIKYSTREI